MSNTVPLGPVWSSACSTVTVNTTSNSDALPRGTRSRDARAPPLAKMFV
jgi:hypothetical protein